MTTHPNGRPHNAAPMQALRPHPMHAIDLKMEQEDQEGRRPRRCSVHGQDMLHLMAGVYCCPHCT